MFWARDHNGYYWICRVTGDARVLNYEEKIWKNSGGWDVGAALPVEAYNVGMEVPGQIKASFNRCNGGTVQKIKDELIYQFSKYVFNEKSGKEYYYVKKENNNNWLNNLPEFDLEELVISYLQIEYGYYVLSNSIANKSTTIKIECELMSRKLKSNNPEKAVVQVKGGNATINAIDYKEFYDKGYKVYLYAGGRVKSPDEDMKYKYEIITSEDILEFYMTHKRILSESITKWENIFR